MSLLRGEEIFNISSYFFLRNSRNQMKVKWRKILQFSDRYFVVGLDINSKRLWVNYCANIHKYRDNFSRDIFLIFIIFLFLPAFFNSSWIVIRNESRIFPSLTCWIIKLFAKTESLIFFCVKWKIVCENFVLKIVCEKIITKSTICQLSGEFSSIFLLFIYKNMQ